MIKINLPASENDIRKLSVGDEVSLHGTIVTARDAAHKFMTEKWPDFIAPLLNGGAIYHCGPIMKKEGDMWKAVAAGPTTSIREEPYEASVIEHYKVRIIIGKGGMGEMTLDACSKFGAVYMHAVGGAAQLISNSIIKTRTVHMLDELGIPEAFWEFEVDGFTGVITMDSKGQSLHKNLLERTKKNRDALIGL